MTSSILGGFFSSTGGKSISWKDAPVGTTYSGTIKALNPPEPQTDIKTQEPLVDRKTGRTKMQVRIDLQTSMRDPQNPDDDGSRSLYVKGWMTGAIGDALRKAGVEDPAVGGKLTVTLSEKVPSDTPGFDPYNKFTAVYQPPAVTAGHFTSAASEPAAPAAQAAPAAAAEPQRPDSIVQSAWDAMDLSTKTAVAATFQAKAPSDSEPPF